MSNESKLDRWKRYQKPQPTPQVAKLVAEEEPGHFPTFDISDWAPSEIKEAESLKDAFVYVQGNKTFIKWSTGYKRTSEAIRELEEIAPPEVPKPAVGKLVPAAKPAPQVTRFPKIVRDTEKSPRLLHGREGKTTFGYDEYVVWPDGEKTLLRKQKAASGTFYRTEGRYEVGSQKPDIGATDRSVLLSKVSQRWNELQKDIPKEGKMIPKPAPKVAKEPNRYEYTWSLPEGKKRFTAYAYGDSWEDALRSIQQYHPKRSNIRKVG